MRGSRRIKSRGSVFPARRGLYFLIKAGGDLHLDSGPPTASALNLALRTSSAGGPHKNEGADNYYNYAADGDNDSSHKFTYFYYRPKSIHMSRGARGAGAGR